MNMDAASEVQYVKWENIQFCHGNEYIKQDSLGLLERPNIPLAVEEYKYRILVVGSPGIGKSFLISWITGLPLSHVYVPTPGIQTVVSHFPAVLQCSSPKEVLFTIQFWESAIAPSKNSHSGVFKGCPDSVDGVMILFSCTVRKSFELLPKSFNDFRNHSVAQAPCFFAVSIGCSSEEQPAVIHKDLIQFEKQWKVPVLIAPFISSDLELLSVAGLREILVSTICENLWLRDQNSLLKNIE